MMQMFVCNRWLSFVAACVMMVGGGTLYGFAAVSHNLKTLMDYSQYEINFIGAMAAVGSALGIFPGLFYDYFGARLTCLVAATFAFTGYFLTYLSLKHTIFTTYWLVGIYFTIIGIGASAGYTAALSTNVKNYNRKHRGKIVGVLTSLFALSSALFSLIYKYVYQQKLIDYLLFLSIAAGAVPLVGFVFLNTVERRKKVVVDSDEYSYDKKLSDEGTEVYEEDENLYLFAQNSNSRMSNQLIKSDYDSEISELLNEGVKQSAPPLRNEYNPIQMLTSIDFWLLFIGLFSSFGSGLMIMNNLASIVVSYGAEDGYQVPMVIIYAVSSCFGRIVFGILSDRYALRVSRATFINVGVLLMGLCQFGFSVATLPYFYPLIVLLGVSYGCIMAVMSAFMSDRFGNKFYGINLSFASISSAAGSYLIGTLLAAHIYEKHIHGTGHLCVGRPCYSMTFLITTGLCMFSFVLGLLLMYRNRKERKRITSPPPNMVSINAIYTEDSLKNVKY